MLKPAQEMPEIGSNALHIQSYYFTVKAHQVGMALLISPFDSIFNDEHDVVQALPLHVLWLPRILEGLEVKSTLLSRSLALLVLTLQRRFVTAHHATF